MLVGIRRQIKDRRCQVAHIHVSGARRAAWLLPLLVLAIPRRVRVLLTVHSGGFVAAVESATPVERALLAWALRRMAIVVAVSADIARMLSTLGVASQRLAVAPAYMPESVDGDCPEQLRECAGGRRIVVCSGYAERHYGFEHVIEAIRSRPSLAGKVCLVLCLYHRYDQSYLAELREALSRLPGTCTFLDLDPAAFNAVLRVADVYVRPTTRDGDAVAIREALGWGLEVIASDCVRRPDGVVTFRLGDDAALGAAIERALEKGGTRSARVAPVGDCPDNLVLEIVCRVAAGSELALPVGSQASGQPRP
jgi:glycosyltransferase involved in cell wall biosynthesis